MVDVPVPNPVIPVSTQPISQPPLQSPPQQSVPSPVVSQPSQPVAVQQTPPVGNKTNKKLIFIILGLVVFFLLISVLTGLFIKKNKSNIIVADLNKGGKNPALTIFEDLSKYDKDTDDDGYPDFIETSLGLDPLVSEYTRCKGNNTCAGATSQNTVKKKNVMIILDASGSMSLLNNGQTRMDVAKDALRKYVASTQASNINMGLMVYGHKGSNSVADKPISCALAEQLAPIGTITSANLDTYLNLINPTGWTPIGLAISNAQASFTGKEQDNNEIMLVTDGEETCDSNPVGAATSIYNGPAKVKVNIIAFVVSSSTLSSISKAGGGSFSSANNSDELIARMNDLYENTKKISEEKTCIANASISFLQCYPDINRKVYAYVATLKSKYYKKEISKAEFDRLGKLETSVWDQGQKAIKE